jgi:hypothetical protein
MKSQAGALTFQGETADISTRKLYFLIAYCCAESPVTDGKTRGPVHNPHGRYKNVKESFEHFVRIFAKEIQCCSHCKKTGTVLVSTSVEIKVHFKVWQPATA